jgi:hypothetical protein
MPIVPVSDCEYARRDVQDTNARSILKEPRGRWGYDVQDSLYDEQESGEDKIPPNVQVLV